ncbi:hypothetical protein K450DRAFT_225947 [Umbelopsis ramanniana AG]|uniref:C2H2-type domain-containing protein n=1 Tax=Umbelopsis ramanniana AG TaxID=1314678 RepID=A0AAD5HHV3_UMBRA|nr:uncharacterized protein K450DRAFT_225947 [Umbelopsis ramanniana AG]KAI8583021.1 hypothetical protein K450DRAFT_225947 [Umbelopsis ramanniana AG]
MFKSFVNIQELEAISSSQLVPSFPTAYIPAEPYWAAQNQPQCTCQCGANKVDVSAHAHAIWNQTNMEPSEYTERQWSSESASLSTTGYPSPIASPEPYLISQDEAEGFYSKPSLDEYADQVYKMEKLGGFSEYTQEGAYGNMVTTEAIFDMSKYRSMPSGLCTPLASPVLEEQQVTQDTTTGCEFLMYAGSNPLYSPPQQQEEDPMTRPTTKSQPSHYKCDFPNCTATFTRPYNLKSHKRTHTNERPYACPHQGCNKTFARHHDRNRHAKLHMGLKPYSCPHCKKCFARQDALIRHSKIENAPCSQVVQTKKLPLKFKFLNGR